MLLTKQNRAKLAARLTDDIHSRFKLLFAYNIEDDYKLSSIDTVGHPQEKRPLNSGEKLELYEALCNFIEKSTNMTYTQVNRVYGRIRDKYDTAIDLPYPDEEFPMEHFSLAEDGLGSIARIHGYIRDGIFVVRRIDWGHRFHKKRVRTAQ